MTATIAVVEAAAARNDAQEEGRGEEGESDEDNGIKIAIAD